MFALLRTLSVFIFNPEDYTIGEQSPDGELILDHREENNTPYKTIPTNEGMVLDFKQEADK